MILTGILYDREFHNLKNLYASICLSGRDQVEKLGIYGKLFRDGLRALRLTLPSVEKSVESNAPHEHNAVRKKMGGLVSYTGRQYHFINLFDQTLLCHHSFSRQASIPAL